MTGQQDVPKIEIYHMEGARSFRIAWLCEEIGLPYELHFVPGDLIGSIMMMREHHPDLPQAPVVRFDGETMVESGAILDVLAMRYGPDLVPVIASPDYLRHAQWSHFAEGSFLSRMIAQRLVAITAGVDVDQLPGGYKAGAGGEFAPIGPAALFDFIESYLGQTPFFGGARFSSADIMMHYAIRIAFRVVWIDYEDYPAIDRWMTTVIERPAYARAVARCLPNGTDKYGMPPGLVHPFTPRPVAV